MTWVRSRMGTLHGIATTWTEACSELAVPALSGLDALQLSAPAG